MQPHPLLVGSPSPNHSHLIRYRHSCEHCRKRKIKCSGTRPICDHCLRRNIPCIYKPLARTTRRGSPMCAQQSAQPIPIPITNFSSSHEGLVASSAPAMFHPSNNNNTQKPQLWSAMPHLYSGASPFGSGETSTPASLLSDTSTQGDAFSPCDLSPWGFAQNMEPPPTHKRRMTNESNDSTSSLPLLQNSSHDQANSNSMGPSYLGVSLPSNSFASTGPSSHLGVSLPSNPFAFSSMGQLDLFAQFGLSVEQPFANSGIAPEMTIQQQGGSSAGPTSNGGSRGGGALG